MGMAASQARFLSLTARKTNVEFEGQQINQQRTSLSNESSDYYSRLCNMEVPTPPSSEDFSKTTYTFTDGVEKNTINSLIAQPNGWYILNYTQSYETESIVSNGNALVTREKVNNNGDNEYTYYLGATKLRLMNYDDMEQLTVDSPRVKNDPYLRTLESSQLRDLLLLEQQYQTMLTEKYPGEDSWYVRYQLNTGSNTYEPVFYSKTQIEGVDYSEKTGVSLTGIKSYVYGKTTETREIKNAKARVEQDSNGRYMSVIIYATNEDGTIKLSNDGKDLYTEYNLTATTETDDRAYNDAMNQYNYEKAVYDQEINIINSKIQVVQGQDKDLELRLKQLDTEQNAISQELEAVKKVITTNIEKSFKTFNA